MGRNFADKVKRDAVQDTSSVAKQTTTKGIIWGEGHVLGDGSPAKGFYVDSKLGPMVQAVPFQRYKNWMVKKDSDEAAFAAANMRLFSVVGMEKKDFNELQDGAHKYELQIDGEFHVAHTATPVVKTSARTLEASVPEGETLKRKSLDRSAQTGPRSRIQRLNGLRSDNPFGASMFHNAAGVLVERPASFPAPGDSWLGGLKTNQTKGEVAIYLDYDADSKLLEADDKGVLKIKANDVQLDADFQNVSYGDLTENPLQAAGFSSIVTPIPRFLPKMKNATWISGLYGGLMDFFAEDDATKYAERSESAIYDHEVIDINSFRPNNNEE